MEKLKILSNYLSGKGGKAILTPQEALLLGGYWVGKVGSNDWYKPASVDSTDPSTIIDTSEKREGHVVLTSIISAAAGFPNPLVFSLEALDSKKGTTVKDPQVVGQLTDDGEIIPPPDDATKRLFTVFEQRGIDLGRRE